MKYRNEHNISLVLVLKDRDRSNLNMFAEEQGEDAQCMRACLSPLINSCVATALRLRLLAKKQRVIADEVGTGIARPELVVNAILQRLDSQLVRGILVHKHLGVLKVFWYG